MVCLLQMNPCFLGGFPGLPLPMLLDKRNAVPPALISDSYEDWCTFARDEDILLLVHFYIVFGENGDVAVVCGFAHTHEGCFKLIKSVCFCCFVRKLWERKLGDYFAFAGSAICNTNSFRGCS